MDSKTLVALGCGVAVGAAAAALLTRGLVKQAEAKAARAAGADGEAIDAGELKVVEEMHSVAARAQPTTPGTPGRAHGHGHASHGVHGAHGVAAAAPRAAPDSAYPTGGAAVAPSELSDPAGARRKLSLEHNPRGPVCVAVAGASGSGKTSIATLLQERLRGVRVVSISSDEYYKTLPHDVDPGAYNFDHPAALDLDLLAEHLAALRKGVDVAVPVYDFVTHRRDPERTTVVHARHTDVIIVDGIFVLHHAGIRNNCDVTIFTVEDLDVCLARRLRRDLVERGRSVESVLTQYTRFVKTGFHSFVAPTMTMADLIIPRARENATAIDLLARDLLRRVEG